MMVSRSLRVISMDFPDLEKSIKRGCLSSRPCVEIKHAIIHLKIVLAVF